MKSYVSLVALATALAMLPACRPDHPKAAPAGQEAGELQVIDLKILTTNKVVIGKHTFSLSAATNYLALHQEDVDVALLHAEGPGARPLKNRTEILSRIVNAGVPVLIVEHDDQETWHAGDDTDGTRTVTVDSTRLAALRSLWNGNSPKTPARDLAVRTEFEWDTDSGHYELDRVEIGIFDRKVWLVHREPRADEQSGSVGIQLKKEF